MKSEEKLRQSYEIQLKYFEESKEQKLQNIDRQLQELEEKRKSIDSQIRQLTRDRQKRSQTKFYTWEEFFRSSREKSQKSKESTEIS